MTEKYVTRNFEAIPYDADRHADKYYIIMRGSGDKPAIGRVYPSSFARLAVEAMEAGFSHGVGATINQFRDASNAAIADVRHKLDRPLGVPETMTYEPV